MKENIGSLSDWIESRELRGYYTFTKDEIEKQFPSASKVYIKTALHRLTSKAKIISPWRNFYVIMPIEYSLKGVIPPVFYMDQLMSYLDRKYYVSLLNAAAFYGASHQRVQSFSVTVELPYMRNTSKNGTSILFFSKKEIQSDFIRKHKTQTGYINVSSPELTAIDLIENEKNVGGLNRVCSVLNELVDAMDLNSLSAKFFKVSSIPAFQRFGYILEHILEREDLSELFYTKMRTSGLKYRKIPFKIGKSTEGCKINDKWKVIINQEIEIDE
ncbi:MAG: type IV toxin-antitoxin system AbiEi family antitoxin [Parabacteroides sp.]|nr:type IV toxin-antitoxin system AbiEi family antitoxin [Parabacteroides sp.]